MWCTSIHVPFEWVGSFKNVEAIRRSTSNFLGRLNCTHFVSRRFYPNVILTVLLIAKWWYFFFELLSSDIKWMLMSGSRFRTWLKLWDKSLYFFNFRFKLQVGPTTICIKKFSFYFSCTRLIIESKLYFMNFRECSLDIRTF
jgi:hypothetical protein